MKWNYITNFTNTGLVSFDIVDRLRVRCVDRRDLVSSPGQ
jgi:hypothetical protein